ncbi:quinoprotein relay system zinc metallohydrolase 2 [Halodurantibacterium flavum]|uniref:Quinoprotein relay system zinc metallohydrolase 2 n=1 Tax=Halodurantibacterium flavum TaxID=1382802 RepID=A0ABW4SCR2_9RHOB
MLHLLLTLCLTEAPAICAERLLPLPPQEDCEAVAVPHIETWLSDRPDLRPRGWRCGAAPALDLAEIAPGLLVHTGANAMPDPQNLGEIANLGVVIGRDAVAVIDAGATRAQGEALYAAIRARTDRPVSHLVLTHIHPDHSFGAEVFREAGAEIVAARNFAPSMAARAETYLQSYRDQIGAQAMLGTRIALPDRVADAETIDLGGARLRLEPVATAHSDSDLVVLHVESGILFTGDLVFNRLAPTLDGSLQGWADWLAQPRDLRAIVPGHGPAPLPWPEGADATRAYLALLDRQVRAALDAGEPMSRAITAPPPGGDWVGMSEAHPRNLSAAYKELEWE